MIHGRITAKSQTTIPRAVREALGIGPGDSVGYEIRGGEVVMRRISRKPRDPFLANFSTFTEWSSEADSAYDVL
jgi:antitoxin PrlF